MKVAIILPLAVAGLAGLIVCTLAGCKSVTKRSASQEQLPASCTLLAMSPEERAAHERRLRALRSAARLERATDRGFDFIVDLRQMSSQDLQLWMENEQKCCSFLRMTSTVDPASHQTRVSVVCPAEFQSEVIETFGLNASGR